MKKTKVKANHIIPVTGQEGGLGQGKRITGQEGGLGQGKRITQ